MKFLNLTLSVSVVIFFTAWKALAQEDASGIRAGPTLAVLEANLKDGFRLSEKAKKVIGLVTKPLGSKPRTIPPSALVNYGDRIGVYRLRSGWFKLIELQNSSAANTTLNVNTSELKDEDEIAVDGVALLRVSDMDAFGGEQ